MVKVSKCEIDDIHYNCVSDLTLIDVQKIWQQLVYLLIQGRVGERLDFDVSDIERSLESLPITSQHRDFIEEQIAEYKTYEKLSLWSEDNFKKLARRLSDLLGVRSRIEKAVITAANNNELTEKLSSVVKSFIPTASENLVLTLSQCFMKDLSMGKDETEIREQIYKQWIEDVMKRSVKI